MFMMGKVRWSVLRTVHDVHVFIEIAVLQQTFECLFHLYSSMDEHLQLLVEALPENGFILDDETLIIEKETGRVCDRWISLHLLNIHDGMTFVVY